MTKRITVPKDPFVLRPHQQDIWDKFFQDSGYRKFYLCGCRRSGKDYLAVRLALSLCMLYDNYHCVYILDLKVKGVDFILNRLLRPLIPGWNKVNGIIKARNTTNGSILFYNDSTITFIGSTSDGENIRGCDINFVICSEAGFYPESAFNLYYGAILPTWNIIMHHNIN
jgi:hypothetical protein